MRRFQEGHLLRHGHVRRVFSLVLFWCLRPPCFPSLVGRHLVPGLSLQLPIWGSAQPACSTEAGAQLARCLLPAGLASPGSGQREHTGGHEKGQAGLRKKRAFGVSRTTIEPERRPLLRPPGQPGPDPPEVGGGEPLPGLPRRPPRRDGGTRGASFLQTRNKNPILGGCSEACTPPTQSPQASSRATIPADPGPSE